jgi:hypothetical protein
MTGKDLMKSDILRATQPLGIRILLAVKITKGGKNYRAKGGGRSVFL